jgi:acetyl esterase/lipase
MEHKAQPWISPAGRIRHTLNRGVAAPLSDAARAGLQPAIASRAQGVSRARARRAAPGLALACAPSTSTQSAPATSVIVAPGGAYKFVGVPGKPEADSVLEWLCATGDAAVFVLKYRVPSVGPPATPSIFGGLPWGEPALMDAQRAVRLVRWWAGHNQSLKLDPLRVGFLGLSAGAHLVAHLAWRHDERLYARLDAVDEENALPDFQILVYPWNLERLAPSSRWLGGSRSCGSPATRRGRCRRSGYARGATRRPRC